MGSREGAERGAEGMRLHDEDICLNSGPGKGLGGPLVLIAGAGQQGLLLELSTKRNSSGNSSLT
jgi:hypothetical protein